MKRFLAFFLCLIITASLLTGASFAASGMDNFKKTNNYESGRFTDVAAGAWYESAVAAAYDFGLVNGISENSFGTGANVTLVEAVTLAARIHSIYHIGRADFPVSSPWYQTYVDYAVENGIMTASRFEDLNRPATRLQFAELMAAALPTAALGQINNIKDGEIPDISAESAAYTVVYTLYRAGILTGKTDAGHFKPAASILREEVAALVSRMADPSLRKSFSIKPENGDAEMGETDIAEAVRLSNQAAVDAIEGCTAAKSAIADGNPIIAAFGAMQLAKARELSSEMAKHITNAAAAAKDKPELEAAYALLESARLGTLETGRLVFLLNSESTTAEWDTAIKMLEGCSDALSRAAEALG